MKFYSTYKLVFQFFATVGLMAGLFSCEKENNTIPGGAKAVVEAYLVPNRPITVKVKKEIAYNEDLSNKETFLSGLNIKITAEGQTYTLKPFQDTLYKSDDNVKVKVGVTYAISFDYNGKTVSASTVVPTKPVGFKTDIKTIVRTRQVITTSGGFGRNVDELVDVNLSWSNPNNDYHFVVADNIEPKLDLIITLPSSSTTLLNDINRRFRGQPVQGTASRLQSQQFQYFGRYNLVLLKVNPDYAALYNSSGTTSQNISTPPSTITNGLGIFTGVNGDTLSFVVRER
ncbi:MAG: DUF4249 domain-containing protein [Arcicella sp.]|jgi:hypothetical protein|nr:DUF4249 domain-containing protein [Arcicella sp.]